VVHVLDATMGGAPPCSTFGSTRWMGGGRGGVGPSIIVSPHGNPSLWGRPLSGQEYDLGHAPWSLVALRFYGLHMDG
jgi:hypothetical protein